MLLRITLVLFLVTLSGCATSTAAGIRTDAPITADELQQTSATTVLEAVRMLRPHWTSRLAGGFLEGQAISPSQLKQEPLRAVAEIRLLSAEEATARYGVRSLTGTYLDIQRRW